MQISYRVFEDHDDRTEAIEIFLFLYFLYKSCMKSETLVMQALLIVL